VAKLPAFDVAFHLHVKVVKIMLLLGYSEGDPQRAPSEQNILQAQLKASVLTLVPMHCIRASRVLPTWANLGFLVALVLRLGTGIVSHGLSLGATEVLVNGMWGRLSSKLGNHSHMSLPTPAFRFEPTMTNNSLLASQTRIEVNAT
jgi:hypothetical protein